jgi:hypothetical protein
MKRAFGPARGRVGSPLEGHLERQHLWIREFHLKSPQPYYFVVDDCVADLRDPQTRRSTVGQWFDKLYRLPVG